jgi:hypothetical protein
MLHLARRELRAALRRKGTHVMELEEWVRTPKPVRGRRWAPLFIVASPLLLALAACGSSHVAGGTAQRGHATATATGVQMTISPSSGPVGTAVEVMLVGVPANTGYGVVSFKDATGAFGEDELTTDYVIDTRTVGQGGSLRLTYKIPANVLVRANQDAQNPTEKTPTASGSGAIVLSVSNVEVETPFTVTGGP